LITGDFHTHGSFSHGKGNAMGNARVASERGLKSIAITEHGMFILVGGLRAKEFSPARKEIEAAKKAYPNVKIYFGVEADIISKEGEIDIPKKYLDEFEVILLGLHYFVWGTRFGNVQKMVWPNFFRRFIRHRDRLKERNTNALVKAMHRYPLDALSHPGTSMPDFDLERVAQAAIETDTCLEINNKHCSLSLEQLRVLAKTDVKFLLGSDAHDPEKVGDVEDSLELALSAGIKRENILNVDKEYIPKKYRLNKA